MIGSKKPSSTVIAVGLCGVIQNQQFRLGIQMLTYHNDIINELLVAAQRKGYHIAAGKGNSVIMNRERRVWHNGPYRLAQASLGTYG